MQIPILSGIYTDETADLRTAYPRNLVPVPTQSGVSQGYLAPADGILELSTGPGTDRGGYLWNDTVYRVMGTSLVSVASDGTTATMGSIPGTDQARFDQTDNELLIVSSGLLYYFDGTTLTQVTDVDLGYVLDAIYLASRVVVVERGQTVRHSAVSDPATWTADDSADAYKDPDTNKAILRLKGEGYVIGRYTIEVLQPYDSPTGFFYYQFIDPAIINRGAVGTSATCVFLDTIAFVGSGRNETLGIYMAVNGSSTKISTQEIDTLLQQYGEPQLTAAVLEPKIDLNHKLLLLHLVDQTLVFDASATEALGVPVWFTLDSGTIETKAQYRARGHVYAYDQWNVADPTTSKTAKLTSTTTQHYGVDVGWEFSTGMTYNEGRGAIFHSVELIALTGRVVLGDDPTVWASYSDDGVTWSNDRAISAGKEGERNKRLVWFRHGLLRNWRILRFRGNSQARLSPMRIEAVVEPLNV